MDGRCHCLGGFKDGKRWDTPYVVNYIDDFKKQFSPNMEGHITLEELENWLKWRTFPPTRANANELLESLGLQAYNRWGIVRKTHGVMADDEIWLRFKGETIRHKDVCLRKELYYPNDSEESITSNI